MEDRLVRLEKELVRWRIGALGLAGLLLLGAAGQSSNDLRLVSQDGKRQVILNADGLIFLSADGKAVSAGVVAYHPEGTRGILLTNPATGKPAFSVEVAGGNSKVALHDASGAESAVFETDKDVIRLQVESATNIVSLGVTPEFAAIIVRDGEKSATLMADQVAYQDKSAKPEQAQPNRGSE